MLRTRVYQKGQGTGAWTRVEVRLCPVRGYLSMLRLWFMSFVSEDAAVELVRRKRARALHRAYCVAKR